MDKFSQLINLAPTVAVAFNGMRIGEFYDTLNHPEVLVAIVNSYPAPVGQMCQDAAKWFFWGMSKPEWIAHAGL